MGSIEDSSLEPKKPEEIGVKPPTRRIEAPRPTTARIDERLQRPALLAALGASDPAPSITAHALEKAPDVPFPNPNPTPTGRPTPSSRRRTTTLSDIEALTARAKELNVGANGANRGETRKATGVFDVQQENALASLQHSLHYLDRLKERIKVAVNKIGPQTRVMSVLERTEELLNNIGLKILSIPDAKIKTAAFYAQKIGTEIDNILKRETEKSQPGRNVVIMLPDSVQRTIGRIRTISENLNLQDSQRLDAIADTSATITELRNMIDMARRIGKGELSKNNDAAEELIGTILEFGESEVDAEWREFLLINAAGRLLLVEEIDLTGEIKVFQSHDGTMVSVERDMEKVTEITRELERFKLMAESNPTTPSEKRNLGRVVHFVNALFARMDLSSPLEKNPNSVFERSFQNFIAYFEAAFREMPFVSCQKGQTLQLMMEVEDAANAKFAVKPEDDSGDDNWLGL